MVKFSEQEYKDRIKEAIMKLDMAANMAFEGLISPETKHKQWYLNEILKLIKSEEQIKLLKNPDIQGEDTYTWEEGEPR